MIEGILKIAPDMPYIALGALVTLLVTALSMFFGSFLGLILVAARLSGIPGIKHLSIAWIEFFLLTPPLIHIIWAYYVLPIVTGLRIDAMTVVVIALTASVGAHMAEVFRAGLQTIPKAQHRAAEVLGLSAYDKYRYVIFPQTSRIILAPTTNTLVSLLKDTSLASVIGLGEILHRAELAASLSFRYLETLTFAALMYVALTYPLILLARWLEQRAKRGFVSV